MIHMRGALPDTRDPRDIRYRLAGRAAAAADNGDLPQRIDNREYCTPVRDQGTEPSCVGHAVSGIAELLYWKSTGRRPALSPRATYSWAREQGRVPANVGGATARDALKAWSKRGIPPDKAWPYVPNTVTEMADDLEQQARAYRLPRYERLWGIAEVRYAIHQQTAVLCTAMTHDGWDRPGPITIRRMGMHQDGGYHAIGLVGYDDDERAFIVRNSWGEDWGVGGYGLWSYADFEHDAADLWLPLIPMTWVGRTWASLLATLFKRR